MNPRLLFTLGILAILLCACAGPHGQGLEIHPQGQMIVGGSVGSGGR